MKSAYWTQQTHLFLTDKYICSACKTSSNKPYKVCPACSTPMKKTKYNPSWVDEAEILSTILDDDW